VTQTRWLDETLTLDYHVNPSPANLEGGGPNWGLWGTKHDYQDFVRVYVPAGTRLVRMAGLDGWAPQPAYGGMQLAGRLLLREGQSRTVVIRYRVPPNVFAAAGPDRYRLHIQHQPGADLQHLQLVVRGGRGVSLGGGRRVRTLQIPLSTDAWVAIRVGGGSPRPVVLPLPPPFPDPYIPFLNLRDPRHPL
jgi:hypothetical protein